MRKTITKKVLSSEIQSFKIVVKDGKPNFEEMPLVTIIGNVTEQRALKEVKNKFGKDNQYSIGKITVEESTYSIKLEDFIEIATKQPKVEKEN